MGQCGLVPRMIIYDRFFDSAQPTCRVSEASNWHFGYHFGSEGPGHRNEKHLILRRVTVLRVHDVFIF